MAKSRVNGVQSVLRMFGKAKSEAAPKIIEAIDRCSAVVLKKALVYVPRDTGALAQSGKVVKATGVGYGARGGVVFGGGEVDYAVPVHENMEKTHAEPTCAKFLERAARESRGACANIHKRTMEDKIELLEIPQPPTT